MPVLAKGKTVTGRLWTYVRDDRPFGGPDPPAAVFFYSRDRGGEHPRRHLAGYAGILQADAYAGFGDLYDGKRRPRPDHRGGVLEPRPAQVLRAGRSAGKVAAGDRGGPPHRRDLRHRARDQWPAGRRASGARQEQQSRRWSPIWKAGCAPSAPGCRATPTTAKAIDYMLKRWPAFTRFLDDGRICLTNNAAERALRGIALGRRAWLFAGSDRGGERAAAMYTLIVTAKLNDVDPQAWLADVLRRIDDHPASRLTASALALEDVSSHTAAA